MNDLISENVGDITALEDRLKKVNDDLKALADRFPVFTSDLNKAKEDLTTAYKKAIEDAITDFKGVLRLRSKLVLMPRMTVSRKHFRQKRLK